MTNENGKRSRMAKILGVDTNQTFKIVYDQGAFPQPITINENGDLFGPGIDFISLCYAINHPESVVCEPLLTKQELDVCVEIGADFVSRDYRPHNSPFPVLWKGLPHKSLDDCDWIEFSCKRIAILHPSIFPSLKPGDGVDVKKELERWKRYYT